MSSLHPLVGSFLSFMECVYVGGGDYKTTEDMNSIIVLPVAAIF